MHGRRVAVLMGEFAFLAGSIGRAAADRLVAGDRAGHPRGPAAARRARSAAAPGCRRAPRRSCRWSGSPQAVAAHKAAGLPYLVYLRHPTTGGVMASWGSLGPRDRRRAGGAGRASSGRGSTRRSTASRSPRACRPRRTSTPTASSTRVVAPEEIAGILDRALTILLAPRHGHRAGARPGPAHAAARRRDLGRRDPVAAPGPARRTPAAAVRRQRRRSRSTAPARASSDPGLLLALVRFGEAPCVFLGQDRRGQTADHPMGPEALREARRGMRLASELGLPLVTVIDTQGAALSPEAENGGLAGEIARCLADLVTLDAPTLCLMLGEGNGGGALALLPADRVVAAQHAWLSPLPPEGASAIVHRDLDARPRDGPRPAGAGPRPARPRHRRPDRRRAARRRRRARGVLPAGRRGPRARARRAAATPGRGRRPTGPAATCNARLPRLPTRLQHGGNSR